MSDCCETCRFRSDSDPNLFTTYGHCVGCGTHLQKDPSSYYPSCEHRVGTMVEYVRTKPKDPHLIFLYCGSTLYDPSSYLGTIDCPNCRFHETEAINVLKKTLVPYLDVIKTKLESMES